jgi:hypothetical protein
MSKLNQGSLELCEHHYINITHSVHCDRNYIYIKMYIQYVNITSYLYIQALLYVVANVRHLQGVDDTKESIYT